MSPSDHWEKHAQRWAEVCAPLRPSTEDLRFIQEELEARPLPGGGGRILLLGVTPELASFNWGEGSELIAVDRSASMIGQLWQGPRQGARKRVVQAQWSALSFEDNSFDLVVGDGCFTTLSSPAEYSPVLKELARVLAPGGRFIHRFFVRPDSSENSSEVFDALREDKIGSFEAFKWRLAMSLVKSFEEGVAVDRIWQSFSNEFGDDSSLFARLGWAAEKVNTMQHYEGSQSRYSFPTLEELREVVTPYFREEACKRPSYELGERCPTVVYSVLDD